MPAIKPVPDALRELAALLPRLLSIEEGMRPGSGYVAAHLEGQWRYVYFIYPGLGGWRGPRVYHPQLIAALHEEAEAQAGMPTEARVRALLADLEAQA